MEERTWILHVVTHQEEFGKLAVCCRKLFCCWKNNLFFRDLKFKSKNSLVMKRLTVFPLLQHIHLSFHSLRLNKTTKSRIHSAAFFYWRKAGFVPMNLCSSELSIPLSLRTSENPITSWSLCQTQVLDWAWIATQGKYREEVFSRGRV